MRVGACEEGGEGNYMSKGDVCVKDKRTEETMEGRQEGTKGERDRYTNWEREGD